jgi:mitogen-activated protein kinase organizer 1
VKFNEYNAVVVSAGYDRTVRAFDCRSQSSDPIQVFLKYETFRYRCITSCNISFSQVSYTLGFRSIILQTINTFQDSVMSVNLTKTEIIAGSVDGTVRTFDIRMGR